MNQYTQLNQALDLAALELGRATGKFPQFPTDPLHAIAILQEEVGELTKAVLQSTYEPHKATKADVKAEAIQVMAMALRFYLSLDDYEYKQSEQHYQSTLDRAMSKQEYDVKVTVDTFAQKMQEKLIMKSRQGYNAWRECDRNELISGLLDQFQGKGDLVDIANYCALLNARNFSQLKWKSSND